MSESIVVNESILQKATKVLEDKAKLEQYIKVCRNASICPKCGEALIIKGSNLICSIDKSHFTEYVWSGEC